eukprot:TRINITY_DN50184_c0_g1_i2.p1 TRINITY_DN50184_c0_g1~~TRINITY_DN50184_c0_g1_i2.p1  ORF type:complete len:244 (+),score=35.74 TRINITY_DN50184_c0_g1_i2:185-916(+)
MWLSNLCGSRKCSNVAGSLCGSSNRSKEADDPTPVQEDPEAPLTRMTSESLEAAAEDSDVESPQLPRHEPARVRSNTPPEQAKQAAAQAGLSGVIWLRVANSSWEPHKLWMSCCEDEEQQLCWSPLQFEGARISSIAVETLKACIQTADGFKIITDDDVVIQVRSSPEATVQWCHLLENAIQEHARARNGSITDWISQVDAQGDKKTKQEIRRLKVTGIIPVTPGSTPLTTPRDEQPITPRRS